MLVLERRAERSATMVIASPLIAVALTLFTMGVLFALLGKNPLTALHVYFVEPLLDPFTLQEIAVKATPLVMIAIGLSLCYLANVWNIGAEGQFIVGAVCGGWVAVVTHWRERLHAIAGEVREGRADVVFADEKGLQYCEVLPLLRLPERRRLLAEALGA